MGIQNAATLFGIHEETEMHLESLKLGGVRVSPADAGRLALPHADPRRGSKVLLEPGADAV